MRRSWFSSTTYPTTTLAHGRAAKGSGYRPPEVGGAAVTNRRRPSPPPRSQPPALPLSLPAPPTGRRPCRSLSGLAAYALIGCLHLYQGAGTFFVAYGLPRPRYARASRSLRSRFAYGLPCLSLPCHIVAKPRARGPIIVRLVKSYNYSRLCLCALWLYHRSYGHHS